ncbi:MAG TPA: hypothetical protein VEP28_10375, partial [Rubrobacter sp.]|nr:hypothetical protein [Rubrobacter sp.]
REDQSVAEMANEVLMRQAKARAVRRGEPIEEAMEAVLDTEAGQQLMELRDGAYAQGHISEEELDAYLDELKKQIDNLRVLLASVEAELSERQERRSLTDTTQAWLLSLGRRLEEVEEDTPEGFEKRKQLIGLLVESISLGRSQQEGRAEVQITYRFGPPPASDAESYSGSSMPHFKNGNRS